MTARKDIDKKIVITTDELSKDLHKYLELSKTHEILISENGQIISILSQPKVDDYEIIKRLDGCLGNREPIDLDEMREQRLRERYGKF